MTSANEPTLEGTYTTVLVADSAGEGKRLLAELRIDMYNGFSIWFTVEEGAEPVRHEYGQSLARAWRMYKVL